ncbi:hypothetical protein EJ02DRAFT_63782 [Clathrospora elynae]|uniref:Malate dehydrogenase n=1 Tax=Clathrospora elynae TaxID=706981 RepID=A0A6A5S934_9PLEO|nr:hypothetical protein EJ02DRAFT_63782 [Clathrospora elynae]
MLFSTLTTAIVLTASVNALPWPGKQTPYSPANNLDNLVKLYPKSALPSPDGLALKYVFLGVGTQNYTCTTGDPSVAPGTTGALATLYDIGTRLNNDRMAQLKINSISPLALSLNEWAPSLLDMSLWSQGYEHVTGHHFFSMVEGNNTPTFSLDKLSAPFPVAQVAKLNATDAPQSACPSKDGLPAVQWLYLKDQSRLSRGGIDTVYRVETAGGNKPATCKGMKPSWEVKYSAQYWVFGPKE